ncbi:MAG TPA: SMP-30/gluconolactonase/LRE family protein [Gemmatimonadaceae bacterium]
MRTTPALVALLAAAAVAACSNDSKLQDTAMHAGVAGTNTDTARATGAGGTAAGTQGASKVKTVDGFKTPESVRWDGASSQWFVSNINGAPPAKDNNGFISRLKTDGTVDSLHFIQAGKNGVTLNAPKGMAISGDTLFVADIDAVRAFSKSTGKPLASWNLAAQGAHFLNDVAIGPNGDVYITDTEVAFNADGSTSHTAPDRIFMLNRDRKGASIAIQNDSLGRPNGLVWDAKSNRFVVVSFGAPTILAWAPGAKSVTTIASGKGQFDGVEITSDGRTLVSSWADSSVSVINGNALTHVVTGVEAPADIGLDPARGLLAVPLFNQGRVEFYQLGAK